MSTAVDVRTALIRQLGAAFPKHTGYRSGQPIEVVPCFVVRRTAADSRTAFGKRSPSYSFDIEFRTAALAAADAEDACDLMCSRGNPESVFDAIEADITIGGTCHTIEDLTAGPTIDVNDGPAASRAVTFTFIAHPA